MGGNAIEFDPYQHAGWSAMCLASYWSKVERRSSQPHDDRKDWGLSGGASVVCPIHLVSLDFLSVCQWHSTLVQAVI